MGTTKCQAIYNADGVCADLCCAVMVGIKEHNGDREN